MSGVDVRGFWKQAPYIHSSLSVHIVLLVLNNGSPKRSLRPFYSNLGYGLLTNRLMCTLTAQTGKNEKEYSWYVPAMKFIGMKQLV